jgi:hypothetical protein
MPVLNYFIFRVALMAISGLCTGKFLPKMQVGRKNGSLSRKVGPKKDDEKHCVENSLYNVSYKHCWPYVSLKTEIISP